MHGVVIRGIIGHCAQRACAAGGGYRGGRTCQPRTQAIVVFINTIQRSGARLMGLTGRVMKGWVTVDGPADLSDEALGEWAALTLNFVKTLPAN